MMTTNTYWGVTSKDSELYHYGVLGMKWGIRRYRNADGSLTPAGKRHESRVNKKYAKKQQHLEEDKQALQRVSSGLLNRKGTRLKATPGQVQRAVKGIEAKQQRLESKRQEKINRLDDRHVATTKRDIRRGMALEPGYVKSRRAEIAINTLVKAGPLNMYVSGLKASKQGKSGKQIAKAALNAGLKTMAVGTLYGHIKAKSEVREAERHFGN